MLKTTTHNSTTMDEDMKMCLQQHVRSCEQVIGTSRDAQEVTHALADLRHLLPVPLSNTTSSHISHPSLSHIPLSQAHEEFCEKHYSHVLGSVIKALSVDWLSLLPKGRVTELVDEFFLCGPPQEAFMALSQATTNKIPGFSTHKCASLLETFLHKKRLQELMWDQCQVLPRSFDRSPGSRPRIDPYVQQVWDELITIIATLPERVTNILQQETGEVFYPQAYVPLVTKDIFAVLKKVYDRLQASKNCSLTFLGQLIGRLCMVGHADLLMPLLLGSVTPLVMSDFVWCRVCEKLINSVPDRCMESVIVPIITHAPWYGVISRLLGQAVIHSQKLQYLLTSKILLQRYYTKDHILHNVIGYLASAPERKDLYIKVLLTLMDVWGDRSALRHTAYEQHLYICKAILVCIAFMSDQQKQQLRDELLRKMMPGMQVHLESSNHRVRRLGMVVAEALTAAVDHSGNKLQFEYERDSEVEQLQGLLMKPEDPGMENIQSHFQGVTLEDVKSEEDTSGRQPTQSGKQDSDLDSDDDFEPYDMSNDVPLSKEKKPTYLRDCMEGLLVSDNPDRVEACLNASEQLIRKHPSSVKEIAVEFSKILLHLDDTSCLPGFLITRHRAMVALAVVTPSQVADYLTSEFYDRNYNIRQRLDILQTLSAAAQELSKPEKPTEKISEITPQLEQIESVAESEHWRTIVEKRIASKTKRFAHGRTQPGPEAVANRFAPVAGHFFFTLLSKFDRNESRLDLLGEDHVVLVRLTYTLGVIMYAAIHAPIARQMGVCLLEFIWCLRYHLQPSVRQALLFALTMTLLAVPASILLTDLNTEVTEAKMWLQDVAEKDVDNECRNLAIQALVLLENAIKKEFNQGAS